MFPLGQHSIKWGMPCFQHRAESANLTTINPGLLHMHTPLKVGSFFLMLLSDSQTKQSQMQKIRKEPSASNSTERRRVSRQKMVNVRWGPVGAEDVAPTSCSPEHLCAAYSLEGALSFSPLILMKNAFRKCHKNDKMECCALWSFPQPSTAQSGNTEIV